MATDGAKDQASYLYLGLAGETGRGRVVHSGLYRLADGSGEWQAIERGLPEMPAIRALGQVCMTHGFTHLGELELARTLLGLGPAIGI